MIKILSGALALCLLCGALAGCGGSSEVFDEAAYHGALSVMTEDVQGLDPDAALFNSGYSFMENTGRPRTSVNFKSDGWVYNCTVDNKDKHYVNVYVSKGGGDNQDNAGAEEAFTYWLDKLGVQSPYTYEEAAHEQSFTAGGYQISVTDYFVTPLAGMTYCNFSIREEADA